ncbi:HAD family hydrolase [Spirosoma sp.]|uniref:HAD family hydrolase n=1 Tax=Spirosoma sp. TaxID=1899569 RepID=UPI003B3A4166
MKLIAFDADDTLWVNEPNFVGVKEKFCELLAHYVDQQTLSSQLYDAEVRNLQVFGYGAKSFMLSMIETAIELTDGAITGREIQQIIDTSRRLLDYPIDVLDGIPEVLDVFSKHFELMVLTKGDLFDQESKLARSGLGHYFKHIEIVSEKNEQSYQRVLTRYNVAPADFIMIGNSLKSDILPVVHIGGRAIYIPSDTTWVHEHVADEQLVGKSFTTLASARELLTLLGVKEIA